MAGTYFLPQTFKLSHINNMGTSNTAQALGEYYVGTAMDNLVGLKRTMICGHGAAQKIIADFDHLNI